MLSDSVMICQGAKLFTQLMRSRMTICSGVSNGSAALATIRAFPASPRSMFVWRSSPKARRTRSAHERVPLGVAIRSCPGVQPRRSYSRLHAIIADSASFANSADRFANNFASDSRGIEARFPEVPLRGAFIDDHLSPCARSALAKFLRVTGHVIKALELRHSSHPLPVLQFPFR